MKILLVGDTHGMVGVIPKIEKKLEIHNIDVVVQLGDFSLFWDKEGFITAFENMLCRNSVDGFFIDGNHDDFSVLAAIGALDADTPQLMPDCERLFYLPRGLHWEWSGVAFGALGGACSIDWGFRELGINWYPEDEIISQTQYNRLTSKGPVDVLLTHDGPNTEAMQKRLDDYRRSSRFNIDAATEKLSNTQREYITAAINKLEPIALYHGHHHHAYATTHAGPNVYTRIFGLDCNGSSRSFRILDTKDVLNLKKGWQRKVEK